MDKNIGAPKFRQHPVKDNIVMKESTKPSVIYSEFDMKERTSLHIQSETIIYTNHKLHIQSETICIYTQYIVHHTLKCTTYTNFSSIQFRKCLPLNNLLKRD